LLSGARQASRIEPGLRTRDVVQVELTDKSRAASIDALKRERVVAALAASSATPLEGPLPDVALRADQRPSTRVHYNIVSPEYFDALDLHVLRGRRFTEEEARSDAPVVMISRSAADSLWPGQNPLGRTLSVSETDRRYGSLKSYHTTRVIGVVDDALPGWVGESRTAPVAYYPQSVDASEGPLLARVRGNVATAQSGIERTLAAVDSGAVMEIHTLEASLALQVYPFQAMYWVALAVGTIALLLTIIGVYGVMAYLVAQRRREFGIRLALGAAGSSLIALVLRQSLRLALLGAVVGLFLAFGVSRVLASVIPIVNTWDVFGYAAGAGVVIGACLMAAYVPSRRAAMINPVDALRGD
jgi:macrolide transport system ATP-binding/permease protein